MVKKVLRRAEKFSEPFPLSPLPLYPSPTAFDHSRPDAHKIASLGKPSSSQRIKKQTKYSATCKKRDSADDPLRQPPLRIEKKRNSYLGVFSGKEKAYQHEQFCPVTAWGREGGSTDRAARIKCLCAVCGTQGKSTISSGCPAGRIGDRGDREIVYVPNVYVPFLAPM